MDRDTERGDPASRPVPSAASHERACASHRACTHPTSNAQHYLAMTSPIIKGCTRHTYA
jgi:hypothetical protein